MDGFMNRPNIINFWLTGTSSNCEFWISTSNFSVKLMIISHYHQLDLIWWKNCHAPCELRSTVNATVAVQVGCWHVVYPHCVLATFCSTFFLCLWCHYFSWSAAHTDLSGPDSADLFTSWWWLCLCISSTGSNLLCSPDRWQQRGSNGEQLCALTERLAKGR